MWHAYPSHAWYYPLVGFILEQDKWLLLLDGLVWADSLMWALKCMGGDDQVGFVISKVWKLTFFLPW